MSRPPASLRFRLRPEHLDLVRAALASPENATRAYRRWRAAVALEDTDAGSYRLIPLVHHNLAGTGAFGNDEAARYARMARFSWVKTRLITHRAEVARTVLADEGVASLAIKGLAVIHHSGLGAGLRPMDDADVIVHTGEVTRAFGVLGAAGFTSDEVDLTDPDRLGDLVAAHHGLNLRDASGVQVDLHWHAIPHALHPDADTAMWRRSDGEFPSREDTLVQVLAHATRWSWAPSVQWIADAAILMRGGIDWSVVTDELRALRVSAPVADGLEVVRSTGLAHPPAGVIEGLRRAPFSQRIEARVRMTTKGTWRPSTRTERLADAYGDHIRRTVPPGVEARPGNFGSFLVERWAVDRMRRLPAHAAWILSGRRQAMYRSATGADHSSPTRLAPGDELAFSTGGNGLGALGRGWSFPENHGSWTIGTEATVHVHIGPDGPGDAGTTPARLRFGVVPFLCEHVTTRRVEVFLDGRRVARWVFDGSNWSPTERVVPLDHVGPLEIRFVVHDPVAPQAVDHDVGTRQLGLSLGTIGLDAATPTTPP